MMCKKLLSIVLTYFFTLIFVSSLLAQTIAAKPAAIQAYQDAWKELDSTKRLKLIQSFWLEKSTYLDPVAKNKGAVALNQMIRDFHNQFPNAILEDDQVLVMENSATWNWRIFDSNKNLLVAGRDVVQLDNSGHILSLVGFWETENVAYKNTKVVESYYQCLFKTGDFTTMETLIADGAVYYQAEGLPYGGTFAGFDQWIPMFVQAGTLFDLTIEKEPDYLINATSDEVIIRFTIACVSKKSGNKISMPISEHFRLKEGKISSIRPFYFDTKKFAEFLN